MSQKKEIRHQYLTGERPLFMGKDLKIYDTIFDNGESPLKESRNIELYGSERLLILSGVVFFIQLPPMPFAHRPPEALIFQSFDGSR